MSLTTYSPIRLPTARPSLLGPHLSFFNPVRPGLTTTRRSYQSVLAQTDNNMEFIRKLSSSYFMDRSSKEQNGGLESVSGGRDVFDPNSDVQPDHLVIMVNGIIGSSEDWRYAAEQFVKKLYGKVVVHRSECNSLRLTFDGVDRMGERLSEEVLDVVTQWPEVNKISFVAHSLGGLVARYAVGRLYQHHGAKIAGLEPINFITVATPHLGSGGNKQLPFLGGLPFLEKQASQTAHLIAGRSGKHLFLTDKDDDRPLLLQMVYDLDDLKFISGLRSFKRRVAYANANYDHVVGWRTSSIRRQHELPQTDLLVGDEKYPHIVHINRETTENIQRGASSTVNKISTQTDDVEEEMIRGLSQVPWERIDVSFGKSRQRYVAHSTIQVKSYWLNSDGADVVLHMIDNFHL
ncbi:putative lipase YDR444W [Apium graveolens]|uniref:putative lipase YDR444W n=1 Tax=Apium graveolens TaxID=4045 RepID=UPI003D794F92